MKRFFVVKWSTEVCLFFENFSNKLRIQSRDLNNREHKQSVFFGNTEEICVLQSVQKEESVSLYGKWTIERQILSKSRIFGKDVTKKRK